MNELIKKIEDVVTKLIKYDNEAYAEAAQSLVSDIMVQLPEIVKYYADPAMSENAQDAQYWPGQLDRIIGALNTGDDIATVDILYNETRANLVELRDILDEKGLL